MTSAARFPKLASLRLAAIAAGGLALIYGGPGPAFAAEAPEIRVSGEASVSAPPDRARLSAGVVSQAQTVDAALDANTAAMTEVFAQIRALGIPENNIQTSNFSVSPQYPPNRPGNREPRDIIGYRVSNQVSIVIDDLARLGEALDALVRSGANQLGGVSFSIADTKPLESQARREAVADAMAKAEELARAAGVRLGPIISIQEGSVARPYPMMMQLESLEVAAVPVAPGEQSVTVNVTMSYAIQ